LGLGWAVARLWARAGAAELVAVTVRAAAEESGAALARVSASVAALVKAWAPEPAKARGAQAVWVEALVWVPELARARGAQAVWV